MISPVGHVRAVHPPVHTCTTKKVLFAEAFEPSTAPLNVTSRCGNPHGSTDHLWQRCRNCAPRAYPGAYAGIPSSDASEKRGGERIP